jgi:SPP1 family predicted phage head-tail adaptor
VREPITSASLRHRLTLQQRSTTRDSLKQQDPAAWSTFLVVWADIAPTPGISQVTGEAQASSVTHTITIRYRPGVAARMRILYGSRVFEIDSVIDVEERHFWLRLNCIEGLSQG